MPQMSTDMKVQLLQSLHHLIFGVIRFPFAEPPGTARFTQLVTMYQERVKRIMTDAIYAAYVIGGQIPARTFK